MKNHILHDFKTSTPFKEKSSDYLKDFHELKFLTDFEVNARVPYDGILSRPSSVTQGTGQGRILAPFVHKIYVNNPLNALSKHSFVFASITLIYPLHLLLTTYLYLPYNPPFSQPLCGFVTSTACYGVMSSIMQKVMLSFMVKPIPFMLST